MSITLQREKTRIYLVGNTYPVKAEIKALGGHWDGDRKAWWVGTAKASEAEALVAQLAGNGSATATAATPKVSDDSKLVGKAKYQGRTYYVLWMGRCSSGAEKAHLTVLDGSIDFWADLSACEILKTYQPREVRNGFYGRGTHTEYTTLGSIRRFIEQQREGERTGNICAECGKAGDDLVHDLEDGALKHRHCCDIEP